MGSGGINSVQSSVQLTVLRRVLEMATAQAKQMVTGMESVSADYVGQTVDFKV